jgi:four helix bundle protein
MRDYTKIIAWQKSDDLTVAIYEATKHFPKDEQWSLTNQLRRAAYSVPANITEGASRDSKKDYLHFLYIARGSLNESHYFIHLAHRLGYMNKPDRDQLMTQADEVGSTLNGLIRAVSKEANIVSRAAAKITSLIALSMPLVSGLRSPVSGL